MLKCVPKIITGVLAVSCLSLAAVNARLMMSTSSSVELSIPGYKITTKVAQKTASIVEKFETKLAEISFPQTTVKKVVIAKVQPKVERIAAKDTTFKTQLINFDEPVKLSKVKFEYSLPLNLVALMPSFESIDEKVMVAKVSEEKTEVVEDKISTTMAAQDNNIEEEPVFFEYPTAKVEDTKVVEATSVKQEVAAQKSVYTKADYEQMADEFIVFDYSNTQHEKVSEATNQISNVVMPKVTETKQAQKINSAVAKAGTVTTQKEVAQKQVVSEEMNALTTQKKSFLPSVMSIQAMGTNFKKVSNVKNFEVRFQDDLNEIYEDYGSGEVQLTTKIKKTMNRSMVLLKRGYAPTNTDLIVENNSKVTLPLIEEDILNEMLDQSEKSAAVGALLVELDDETEAVLLDAEYTHEVYLDKNLRKASDENYSYKLFVGLPAGNIFVKYQNFDGSEASKIVHIHEREVSFDANLYENVNGQQVVLYEEGLLSKELSPLITGGGQVRLFATEEMAKKLNQNTYKLNKKKALLGERHYLEINHLSEPIFVGYRDTNKLILPSENFIKFVLSNFENRKLANRCLIQVNLDAPVANFVVGTESAGNHLMTQSQVLDQDGKFYDSIGPKSSKIIIMGENYAPMEQNQDGKVNIKIDYLDGTSRFLSSYCSPNTYLVEQL